MVPHACSQQGAVTKLQPAGGSGACGNISAARAVAAAGAVQPTPLPSGRSAGAEDAGAQGDIVPGDEPSSLEPGTISGTQPSPGIPSTMARSVLSPPGSNAQRTFQKHGQ